MRCFAHRDLTAVGVCSICGRGVCEGCVIEVGNRLTCGQAECRASARVMRGLTAASQPRLLYGGAGALFVALGVALAVSYHDWIPLIFVALGALLIAAALIAERKS